MVSKSFREARQEITGDSWLDDLYRASLSASSCETSQGGARSAGLRRPWARPSRSPAAR